MKKEFIHIIPLIIFTIFGIIGAAFITGSLSQIIVQKFFDSRILFFLSVGLGLLIIGIFMSFLHLGHKLRGLRSLIGLNHSWLSREALTAGILSLLVVLIILLMDGSKEAFLILPLIGILLAVFFVFSIGMVYNLDSQKFWRGLFALFAPLITMLYLAAGIFQIINEQVEFIRVVFVLLGILDILLAFIRFRTYLKLLSDIKMVVFSKMVNLVKGLFIFRLVIAQVFLLFFVLGHHLGYTPLLITLYIAVDRIIFYAGSVKWSSTAEVKKLNNDIIKKVQAEFFK